MKNNVESGIEGFREVCRFIGDILWLQDYGCRIFCPKKAFFKPNTYAAIENLQKNNEKE